MSHTIAVLSYSDEFYSTQRLMEVGQSLGHRMLVMNPFSLTLTAESDGIRLKDRGRTIEVPDVIVPRVGAVLTEWNLGVVDALIQAGARSAVTRDALALASDKARTSVRLAQRGLPMVPTHILREREDIDPVLEALQDESCVLKLPHGTQGRNVVGATSRQAAKKQLQRWISEGHVVLVQPWIRMAEPRDLRVLIIGNQAFGCAWRIAAEGEFRSNLYQGGKARRATLTDEAKRVAEAAAQALNLTCGAVDLIETPEGLAVLEVNGCPGFKSIESTSNLDAATPWLEAAIHG
jgi:ribosomal protein S6--L-glutamate ligase